MKCWWFDHRLWAMFKPAMRSDIRFAWGSIYPRQNGFDMQSEAREAYRLALVGKRKRLQSTKALRERQLREVDRELNDVYRLMYKLATETREKV